MWRTNLQHNREGLLVSSTYKDLRSENDLSIYITDPSNLGKSITKFNLVHKRSRLQFIYGPLEPLFSRSMAIAMSSRTQTMYGIHDANCDNASPAFGKRLFKSLSLNSSTQHYCKSCGKHRSRKYSSSQDRRGDIGICSRPGCAWLKDCNQEKIIVEVHYYYHAEPQIHYSSPRAGTSTIAELPGDQPTAIASQSFVEQLGASGPPRVNYSRKPFIVKEYT